MRDDGQDIRMHIDWIWLIAFEWKVLEEHAYIAHRRAQQTQAKKTIDGEWQTHTQTHEMMTTP